MARSFPKNGVAVGQMALILSNNACDDDLARTPTLRPLVKFISDLSRAVAVHIGATAEEPVFYNARCLGLLQPREGTPEELDGFDSFETEDLLDIALETGLPDAAHWATRYIEIARALAAAVADKLGVALINIPSVYDGRSFVHALFHTAYDGQDCPVVLKPSQLSRDAWNADSTDFASPLDFDASINRRDTLDQDRWYSMWPTIEAAIEVRLRPDSPEHS